MLVGFGGFGQGDELPAIPGASSLTAAAIVQLGKQLPNGQQCVSENGEVYCLSRQSHLKSERMKSMAMAAGGAIVVGVVAGYLLGRP